jgi:hypothetical protein
MCSAYLSHATFRQKLNIYFVLWGWKAGFRFLEGILISELLILALWPGCTMATEDRCSEDKGTGALSWYFTCDRCKWCMELHIHAPIHLHAGTGITLLTFYFPYVQNSNELISDICHKLLSSKYIKPFRPPVFNCERVKSAFDYRPIYFSVCIYLCLYICMPLWLCTRHGITLSVWTLWSRKRVWKASEIQFYLKENTTRLHYNAQLINAV